MQYEIVTLEEKSLIGISARTSNQDPNMPAVIGGLWEQFYSENGLYHRIQNKKNDKSLGIYSDYAGNEKNDYTITVACETTSTSDAPDGSVARKIPAGKYAKFVLQGNMHQIVADFWAELWKMDLDRSFTYDFEEYQNADMEQAIIHVYIALKD